MRATLIWVPFSAHLNQEAFYNAHLKTCCMEFTTHTHDVRQVKMVCNVLHLYQFIPLWKTFALVCIWIADFVFSVRLYENIFSISL